MTHEEIQRLASSNIDDEISEADRKIVLQHLEECKECRQFVLSIEQMRKEIAEIKRIQMSEFFANRVVYSIERGETEIADWINVEQLARNTSIALAVIVVLIMLFTHSNNGTENVMNGQFVNEVVTDTSASYVLLEKEEITKNDLLFAALAR